MNKLVEKELLNTLKRITFITKSNDQFKHAGIPWDHEQRMRIVNLNVKYNRSGDYFAEEFAKRLPKVEVDHISLTKFESSSHMYLKSKRHLFCLIGGDGTFLNAAQKIPDSSYLCLAINPEPLKSIGQLCGYQFDSLEHSKQASEDLFMRLQTGQYFLMPRSRIESVNITNPTAHYPLGSFWLTQP